MFDRRNFILGGVALAGCASNLPKDEISDDEYEIISALGEDYICPPDFNFLTIQDTTLTLKRTPLNKLTAFTDGGLSYVLNQKENEIDPAAINNLYRENATTIPLNPAKITACKIEGISSDDASTIIKYEYDRDSKVEAAWLPARLRKYQSGMISITKVSRFGFNNARTLAIGVIEVFYGAHTEGADLIIGSKETGSWTLKDTITLWVT